MSAPVDDAVVTCGLRAGLLPRSAAKAIADVMDERISQLGQGFAPGHDDGHSRGELAFAAMHYLACACLAGAGFRDYRNAVLRIDIIGVRFAWPFEARWWKPGLPRRMLVKTCALLLAEIERLDRTTARPDA